MVNSFTPVKTDFFELQTEAQKKSRLLLACFILMTPLAVLATYFILYFLPCFIISDARLLKQLPPIHANSSHRPSNFKSTGVSVEDRIDFMLSGHDLALMAPKPIFMFGGSIGLLFLAVAIRETVRLKNGGGEYVAEKLGGQILAEDERHPKLKMLRNTLEEMAVASGLPCPKLYLLPREMGLNALTAGLDQSETVIMLTQGAVNILDRDELQAVLAHELAHILNYDFRLNSQMAAILSGLMLPLALGRAIMEFINHNNGIAIAGIFYLAGLPGFVLGTLIQYGFSRQREYLADSMAVQFTRNPAGLASALKKIGGYSEGGLIHNGPAVALNSSFITAPTTLSAFLRTHPRLETRILNIEQNWDGNYPEVKPVKFLKDSPMEKSVTNILNKLE